MEKINMDYSIKNILFPSNDECEVQLASKVRSLIKRMWRKALEYFGKSNDFAKEIDGSIVNIK